VNTGQKYHVFLTLEGDCNGLYIAQKGKTSFEVRELKGGGSNISFSYRIVAKRKGHEKQRLARVNRDQMKVMIGSVIKEELSGEHDDGKKVTLNVK